MNRQDRNFLILCGTVAAVIISAIIFIYQGNQKVDELISAANIEQEIEQSKQIAGELIRRHEVSSGMPILKAYPDGGGYSIGYGHYGVDPDEEWTVEQAEIALIQDLDRSTDAVFELVLVPLTIGQRAALIDFVYNFDRWRFANSTLLAKLNQGDYGAVPAELQRWVYGTKDGEKVILPGLVTRREAEIELWLQ